MKIPGAIFTYEPDGPLSILAARAARRAGMGKPYIIQDESKPLSSSATLRAAELKYPLITTDFDRKGNLNGLECVHGMLQCYKKIMDNECCDYVLKIDSDTLLTRSTTVYEAASHDRLIAAVSIPEDKSKGIDPRPAAGACMLLSRVLVEEMLSFIHKWNGLPNMLNSNMPEDVAIGSFAVLLDATSCLLCRKSSVAGFGYAWDDGTPYEDIESFKERFEFVTFGNPKDVDGNRVSRTTVYGNMVEFSKHLGLK